MKCFSFNFSTFGQNVVKFLECKNGFTMMRDSQDNSDFLWKEFSNTLFSFCFIFLLWKTVKVKATGKEDMGEKI